MSTMCLKVHVVKRYVKLKLGYPIMWRRQTSNVDIVRRHFQQKLYWPVKFNNSTNWYCPYCTIYQSGLKNLLLKHLQKNHRCSLHTWSMLTLSIDFLNKRWIRKSFVSTSKMCVSTLQTHFYMFNFTIKPCETGSLTNFIPQGFRSPPGALA